MRIFSEENVAAVECERIQGEYKRREASINADFYAPWQPAELLICSERKRRAAVLLHDAGVFPKSGEDCLEIGFGSLGWLGDLIGWGVAETNLHGIELDPLRARRAQRLLPAADLRVGDATQLPWNDRTFHLVVVSTVFTSILDTRVRQMIANEVNRVTKPGGALLWYDFAVNNPRNPNVRRVHRRELAQLFPWPKRRIKSVTLAPPLARLIAPRSWALATLLELVPILRTHLLAVMVKSA